MRPLLVLAARSGNAEICRLLIESGADPSLRDAEGDDALSVAIRNRNAEAAAVLRSYLAPEPLARSSYAGDNSSKSDVRIKPASVADDKVTKPDQWEEIFEASPPPDNSTVRTGAAIVQGRISEHDPIDSDHDWADVEIELPDSAIRHGPAQALWLDEVRGLIGFGLSWGWVTSGQVFEVAEKRGGREDVHEIESRLRVVLGDVGIAVEEDDILEWIADRTWRDSLNDRHFVNGDDGMIDDALIFLDDLSAFQDPLTCYWKEIRQMEAVRPRRLRNYLNGRWRGQTES